MEEQLLPEQVLTHNQRIVSVDAVLNKTLGIKREDAGFDGPDNIIKPVQPEQPLDPRYPHLSRNDLFRVDTK